jgi:MFS family permease
VPPHTRLSSTGRAHSVTASYRELFAEPALRRLAWADVCARLPQGMVSVALLLVVAQHAPMTVAALAVAAYTLGQAVTGPLRGRLADRYGLIPVATVCSLGYAAALLALLVSALSAGPAGSDIGTAALAGLLNPPLSPGLRSLWSARVAPRLRQTAFALDAAVFDLAYITGPVLASALATGLAPSAALGLMLALTVAAVITIARSSRPTPPFSPASITPGPPRAARPLTPARPPTPAWALTPARRTGPRSRPSPLRSRSLRELLLTAALANAALSATEVALIAYVRHRHALWASGPLLAEVSVGSIVGSLLLGARGAAQGAGRVDGAGRVGEAAQQYRRLPRLLVGYTGGLALLTVAGLYPPLLAVAAPLAGLCLGSTLATLFGAAAGTAPDGGETETQAWINSIMNGGAAGGAALAGFASGQPLLALALATATAAAAAVSAVVASVLGRSRPENPAGHARD